MRSKSVLANKAIAEIEERRPLGKLHQGVVTPASAPVSNPLFHYLP